MTAPATDPKILQIMDALCVALRTITQANGYYNDVAGVDIEPIDFDGIVTFPQIVVEEHPVTSDSSTKGQQVDVVLQAHGYVQTTAASGYRTAIKFRDDILKAYRSITAKTFLDVNGKQLLHTWDIDRQPAEIVPAARAQGFLEVVVSATATYRDFSPPASGI